ncbi:PmoA family protein [Aeoliella sp. ICT_H6.2]|uniref:PmoA family protein n=1 Tax=Aeoliella straminimaris TaxID=2954799 RepID=A0A9X2JIC2_9BACT|nr:PmoA family protein [Aeoliella straminimaris]MCO6046422.1 PmoA family protein [Aeoliella straminimaris]
MFAFAYRPYCWLCAACLAVASLSSAATDAEMGMSMDDDGVTITIDGEIFTRYVKSSGTKPILYPVIGPTGKPVTRDYPMQPAGPHERDDHPHHRSIWFGYEGINGADFWAEPKDPDNLQGRFGRQVHKNFKKMELDGDTVLLVTEDDYVDFHGEVVAQDERIYRFGTDGDTRWIDVTIKLWSPTGPLKIGDTKEGAFAVRVAGTMKNTAKMGGKYISSNGDENGAAWGKPAAWVDYNGPVEGETVGIAIMAHPSSLQPEPRWHVREYGLFAANPIGAADYTKGQATGGLEREEGEPIVLRHRILIHKGDHTDADIAGAYAKYAQTESDQSDSPNSSQADNTSANGT